MMAADRRLPDETPPVEVVERIRAGKLLERLQQCEQADSRWVQRQSRAHISELLNCLLLLCRSSEQLKELSVEERKFCGKLCLRIVCFFLRYAGVTGKATVDHIAMLKNAQLLLYTIEQGMFLSLAKLIITSANNSPAGQFDKALLEGLGRIMPTLDEEQPTSYESLQLNPDRVLSVGVRELVFKIVTNVFKVTLNMDLKMGFAEFYLRHWMKCLLEKQPNFVTAYINCIEASGDYVAMQSLISRLVEYRHLSGCHQFLFYCFARLLATLLRGQGNCKHIKSVFYTLREATLMREESHLLENLLLVSVEYEQYSWAADIVGYWLESPIVEISTFEKKRDVSGRLLLLGYVLTQLANPTSTDSINHVAALLTGSTPLFRQKLQNNETYLFFKIISQLNFGQDQLVNILHRPATFDCYYHSSFPQRVYLVLPKIQLQCRLIWAFKYEQTKECRKLLFGNYYLLIVSTVIEFVFKRRPAELLAKALQPLFDKCDSIPAPKSSEQPRKSERWLDQLGYLCASSFFDNKHPEYWEKVARLLLRSKQVNSNRAMNSNICRQLMKGLKHYLNSSDDTKALSIKDLVIEIMQQTMATLKTVREEVDHYAVEAHVRSQVCVFLNSQVYQTNQIEEVVAQSSSFYDRDAPEQPTLKVISYYLTEELLRLLGYRAYNHIKNIAAASTANLDSKPEDSNVKVSSFRDTFLFESFIRIYDIYYKCYTARHNSLTQAESRRTCYLHFYELTNIVLGELYNFHGFVKCKQPASPTVQQLSTIIKKIEQSQLYQQRQPPLSFFRRCEEDVNINLQKHSLEEVVHLYSRLFDALLRNRCVEEEEQKATPIAQLLSPFSKEPEPKNQDQYIAEMCSRSQRVLPLLQRMLYAISSKLTHRTHLIGWVNLYYVEGVTDATCFSLSQLLRSIDMLVQVAGSQGDVQTFHLLVSCKLSVLTLYQPPTAIFDEFEPPIRVHVMYELSKHAKQNKQLREFLKMKVAALGMVQTAEEFSDMVSLIRIRSGLHLSDSQRLSDGLKRMLLLEHYHLSVPLSRSLILQFTGVVYQGFIGFLKDLVGGRGTRHHNHFASYLQTEYVKMDKSLLGEAATQHTFTFSLERSVDYTAEQHRLLPELLVETLELMYRHGQLSEMQAFKYLAMAYLCRSNSLLLAARLMRFFVKDDRVVDFSRLYDGLTGIVAKLHPLSGVEGMREMLFNKRKSLSVKYTLSKLCRSLQKMTSGMNADQYPLLLHFNSLMMRYFAYTHEQHRFHCELLIRKSSGSANLLDEMVLECWEGKPQLERQLALLNHLLGRIMECNDDYQQAVLYFDAYGWLDSLVTKGISTNKEVLCRNDVKQYCKNRNTNYLRLAVQLMDYNYHFKRMSFCMPKLEKLADEDIPTFITKVTGVYDRFMKRRPVDDTIAALSANLTYPLYVLLPMGDRLLNIAVHNHTITSSSVPINGFLDNYLLFDRLISRNEAELRITKPLTDWWKARERLNREVGRILSTTDVGVFPRINNLQTLTARQKRIMEVYGKDTAELIAYAASIDHSKQKQLITALSEFVEFSSTLNQLPQKEQTELVSLMVEACHSEHETVDTPSLLLTWVDISQFPFECTSAEFDQAGVYRVPSASYILQHDCKGRSVNINELSYLINPGLDLAKTASSFHKIAKPFSNWNGIINKQPTHSQFIELLQRQVFLYMGHGSGSQYLPQPTLFEHKAKTAALLFGCSSVKMQHRGSEAHGTAHTYLLSQCPVLLGCLWDVTDIDTDACTDRIFKAVTSKNTDLSYILEKSKKQCKMEFLNGSAMVVYGMPCSLYNN